MSQISVFWSTSSANLALFWTLFLSSWERLNTWVLSDISLLIHSWGWTGTLSVLWSLERGWKNTVSILNVICLLLAILCYPSKLQHICGLWYSSQMRVRNAKVYPSSSMATAKFILDKSSAYKAGPFHRYDVQDLADEVKHIDSVTLAALVPFKSRSLDLQAGNLEA